MNIIFWIIFGALIGWIATIITSTEKNHGVLGNVVIGIAGSVFGGFVINALGGSDISSFNVYSLLVAIFGSVAILFVWKRSV